MYIVSLSGCVFTSVMISLFLAANVFLRSPLSTMNMWNLTLQQADESPRLDWMAVRIQGKHFASKFELIIDRFPELQMTFSEGKVEKDRGWVDKHGSGEWRSVWGCTTTSVYKWFQGLKQTLAKYQIHMWWYFLTWRNTESHCGKRDYKISS